ncbi:MAG TPA: amidohydrolase family protein [Spirochaetia bacterium]|nr:amidohydrolase family protein [Spirochaetia bacterium]
MIVDAHTHIQVGSGEESSYSPWGMKLEGVTEYLENFKQNRIDACFVFGRDVFRDSSLIPATNDGLAKLKQDYPERLFPFGTVNPNWPEKRLKEEIRRIALDLKLYGIKLVPLLQGFPISSTGMDILAREAGQLGLPVFFHDGSPEYCSAVQVIAYARMYPQVHVISGHGGLREQWPEFIPAARSLQNLWICLMGPTQWGMQQLYDHLGAEKLMFGSDGGLGHPAIIRTYLKRIERLRAPESDKRLILGENAWRFLHSC